MKVKHLKHAKLADVLRLAAWLGLRVKDGWSKGRIARLIHWRVSLHRPDMLEYWLNRNKGSK